MFKEKYDRKQEALLGLLSGHYTIFSASVCSVRLDGPTFGWDRDGGWAIARPILTQCIQLRSMSRAGVEPVVSVLTACALDGCCCYCRCCYFDLQQNCRKIARNELEQAASLLVTVCKTGPTIEQFPFNAHLLG